MRLRTVCWIAFSLFIVYATTFPFTFTTDQQIVEMKLLRISPNPLVDARTNDWVPVPGLVLNVLFFVPFGALGSLSVAGRRSRRILFVTMLALVLSTFVEGLQVFTRNRIPSSADLLANTIGAFAGAAVADIARARRRSSGA